MATIGEPRLGSFRLGSAAVAVRVGSFRLGNQQLGSSDKGLHVGSFSLGRKSLSTAGTEGATATTSGAVGFPTTADPDARTTAEASKATAVHSAAAAAGPAATTAAAGKKISTSGQPTASLGAAEASSGGTAAVSATTALVSAPKTDASSGNTQMANGAATAATADTETTTDTITTTMVSGTVLASSGKTAAAGAETLTINSVSTTGAATTSTAAVTEKSGLKGVTTAAGPTTAADAGGGTASLAGSGSPAVVSLEIVSPASVQSVVGSGITGGGFGEATAGTAVANQLGSGALGRRTLGASGRTKTRLSAAARRTSSVAAKTALALNGAAQANARTAPSLSEGVSGGITAVASNTLLSGSFSEGIAPGDVGVLATAATKAGSAFTAVVGGETLTLNAGPAVVDPFTETTTDPDPAGDERVGGFALGTTNVGFTARPLLQTAKSVERAVDSFTEALGAAPDTTDASTDTFLVESVSEGIGGSTTAAAAAVFGATATTEGTAGETQPVTASFAVASGATSTTGGGLTTPLTATGTVGVRYLTGWALYPGPAVLGETTDEKRTWNSLEIELRTDSGKLENIVEGLDSNSGAVATAETSDGGFIAEDTAGGDNTYRLAPPTDREPLRVESDFLVADYEDSVVDSEGNVYDVALELIPDSPRDTNDGVSEANASGEWYFGFDRGSVSTTRVSAEVSSKSSDGTETRTIRGILTHEQAIAIEESCVRQAAVRTRVVQDGTNTTEDNSPDSANTVYIDPPDGETDVITEGDYAVTSWVSTIENDRYQRVEISVSAV